MLQGRRSRRLQQGRPAPMKPRAVVCLCLLAAGGAGARPAPSAAEQPESGGLPLGYTPAAWDQGLLIEEQYASLLDRARISRTHEALTREPHRAGTEGARRVAAYIKQEADRAGFHAEIVPYLFYNSHPGPRSIELTAPLQARLSLVEDRIPGDPFTEHAADHQAFCAYSGSGAVEAEVVYVGQGTVRDFRTLEDNGISLQGRVALMRYFGEWEGRKVLRAQERGAAGAILYADPQEDGFIQGPVYPHGAWRPPGSIMRRTLADTPYEGDPLSPGWAAVPGARRLDPQKVAGLPKIPVLPISYRDAAVILSHLEGPAAPEAMQGGLRRNATGSKGRSLPKGTFAVPADVGLVDAYHLGPGPARIKMSVQMSARTDTIMNVLVRIPGKEEPDSWVILGNHHDAWIYGAGPSLHRVFKEVAAAVPGPKEKESLSVTWVRLQNETRGLGSVDAFQIGPDASRPLTEPRIDDEPLGDDQTPFVEFLAIPGSDMYYGADYGMYHSLYEDRHWMTTVVDPEFRLHRVMAEVHGRIALRLAMAPLLPLDPAGAAAARGPAFSDLPPPARRGGARPQLVP